MCFSANFSYFPLLRFLQSEKAALEETPVVLKAPVNLSLIETRKDAIYKRKQSTPYAKQKSSLELEFSAFLAKSALGRDIATATPDDVVNSLIWKDQFGKTVVHLDLCPFFGQKKETSCRCPKRLAYGSLDSLVGKLRAIFSQAGRTLGDSGLPGFR